MRKNWTRRNFLASTAAAMGAGARRAGARAPASTVSLAACRSYEPAVLTETLGRMFDQIGGLGRIVNGKTVALKINMTGTATFRSGHLPVEMTAWTHPDVVLATMELMNRAGAKRIRILESPWKTAAPVEEVMMLAGWEPREFLSAAKRVEFENTNYLGEGTGYHRVAVPHGGLLFPSFDLNHSYVDCDAFVSIAKMKEHSTTGITLAMKNCFGITPCTIYGDTAGEAEPSAVPTGGRGNVIHWGQRQPSRSSLPEVDPDSPRRSDYRVPRCVVDLIAARPVDLSIIDGITSQAVTMGTSGGIPVSPGVLVAGTNPVCTDAVGAAVMGFDPMADRGRKPFEYCDNMLRLAEDVGLGSRDLDRIEVAGAAVRDVVFDYRAVRAKHGIPAPRPPIQH